MSNNNKLLRTIIPFAIALLFVFLAPRLLTPKGKPQPGKAPAPVVQTKNPLAGVQDELQRIDALKTRAQLDGEYQQLTRELDANKDSKDPAIRTTRAQEELLLGYTWERLAKSEDGALAEAVKAYNQLGRTEYAPIAYVRLAQVQRYMAEQSKTQGMEAATAAYDKAALKAWEGAANLPPTAKTLVRTPELGFETSANSPGTWTTVPAREFALKHADAYYQSNWMYKFFEGLVTLVGGAKRNSSYILAIVLIAVLAKLITTPFSVAQFRSMREMQKIQPELKKLQEKYKGGDQKEFAKAQMQLFRDHNVNPMSSCLPMIVQTGILIYVYYGIRHFLYRFWDVGFLYLHNLANPDMMPGLAGFPGPLLLLYAVSMFFTQKLISMPAATPEQAQQQKMMAYLMPVFLLFVLKGLPAAFILYWLLQNILMTGHQWLIMRPHRAALATAAANGAAPAQPQKAASSPPPAAIQRLSQGTRPAAKKKRR